MKKCILKLIAIVVLFTMFFNSILPIVFAYEEIIKNETKENEEVQIEDETKIENSNEKDKELEDTDLLDLEKDNNETTQENQDEANNIEEPIEQEENDILNPEIQIAEENMQNKNEKTIEEGIYEIASAKDSSKFITIDNTSNAVINTNLNSKRQKFKVSYKDEYYTIQALDNNEVLDVAGGRKEEGTNVQSYKSNGTDAQKWIIKDEGNGEYSIISYANGLYLDIKWGVTSNGTNLQVYGGNGSSAQRFKFKKVKILDSKQTIENGEYYIKMSKDITKVLEIDKNSNVHINEKNNKDNQRFYLEYISEGYYIIQNKKENKVLDIDGGNTVNGTNVQVYKNNGTSAQKWIIKDEGNDKYSIISWKSELYLDVAGGRAENGNNVQIYEGNGTEAQQFIFERVHKSERKKTIEDGEYKIVSALGENKVISVNDRNSNVELWEDTNEYNKRFNIKYIGDGYYTIQVLSTKKMLDVQDESIGKGSNVQVYRNNGVEAQQWIIKELEDGYYSIISKLNDLNIDVLNANTENGTNVQVYEDNGNDAQKFKLIRVNEEGKKTLKDGIYKIKTALDPNMVLDIAGGSKENNANLQIWSDSNVKQQRFFIKYLGNGSYKIRPIHSRKALDVDNAKQKIETNVKQYEAYNSEAQQWIIKEDGNGYYNIISKCNYLYLDVQSGQANNGTNVQMYLDNGTNAQKFIFEKMEEPAIEDGVYEIQMSKDKTKVLDISAGSFENSANLQIWTRDNVNQQKFSIIYNEQEKNYIIKAVHSGKVLDVAGGRSTNCTNVHQYDANETNAQKWKIEDLGDGTYNIISQCGGLYLDVDGGRTTNGTNVHIYENNGTEAQKFVFVKTEIVPKNVLDYSSIDNSKYPGFKTRLAQLKSKHPNWKIRVMYTGLDWNSVVNNEYGFSEQGTPRSLIQSPYLNEWKSSEDDNKYDVSQNWYRASKKGIAYMMDPRNSLEEEWMFQFQNLGSSSGTYQDIAKMVEGTYLNSESCIRAILEAAIEQNISPFHITSRILHEQGNDGHGIMNGYEYMGKKVYNLYNIAVTGNTSAGIIAGARYAYEQQWFTPEASIKGGAEFLKRNYISKGQSTLYFQKYNVISNPLYEHQYMQNIRAANDEGKRIYTSYKDQGLLDCQFEFVIPIYENMPVADSPVPKR